VHIETFLIVSKTSRQENRVSLRTFIITSGSGRPFTRDIVCIPRVWNFKLQAERVGKGRNQGSCHGSV